MLSLNLKSTQNPSLKKTQKPNTSTSSQSMNNGMRLCLEYVWTFFFTSLKLISNKSECTRTVKKFEDPICKANVGKIPMGVKKPIQMAKEKPIQMASKAQQTLAKGLRSPKKSNIKNDVEKD